MDVSNARRSARFGMGLAYLLSMTFSLAFSTLAADAPRQRARCSASGRFVAWSKVPQLRAPGAPRLVVIAAPLVAVADGAPVAPAAPAAEAPPLGIASALPIVARGFVASVVAGARSLVATARAAVVVAGLALGGLALGAIAGRGPSLPRGGVVCN